MVTNLGFFFHDSSDAQSEQACHLLTSLPQKLWLELLREHSLYTGGKKAASVFLVHPNACLPPPAAS